MKIKSQAHHRKIQELVKQGKLKREVLHGAVTHSLPERLEKKPKSAKFRPLKVVK